MDTQTVWTVMDRIREQQIKDGALLVGLNQKFDGLAKRQNEIVALLTAIPARNGSTLMPRLLQFLAGASVKSAAQWMVVMLTVPYLAKGGDILQLLKILTSLL